MFRQTALGFWLMLLGAIFMFRDTVHTEYSTVDGNTKAGSCENPTAVEAFASSFYTALVVSNDPEIVSHVQIPGGKAAFILYNAIKEVLESYEVCNAEEVAFSGAHALVITGRPFDLRTFFDKVSYTFGIVLFDNGILSCGNAVALSLELVGNVRNVFKNLDPTKIESYARSVVEGVVYLYHVRGLKLEIVTQKTSDVFEEEYEEDAPPQCKFDKSS